MNGCCTGQANAKFVFNIRLSCRPRCKQQNHKGWQLDTSNAETIGGKPAVDKASIRPKCDRLSCLILHNYRIGPRNLPERLLTLSKEYEREQSQQQYCRSSAVK
jgi:hypothetical protein